MKVLKWLNINLEKTIAAILFMSFTAVMIINVVLRFIFHNSLSWASEFILILFIWFVWISISYAFKERVHIRVTGLISLLSKKSQKKLELITNIFILIFFISLVKVSIDLLGHFSVKGKTSLLLGYPMWVFYLSSVVGGGLSVIRIFQNILLDIKDLKIKKRSLAKGGM